MTEEKPERMYPIRSLHDFLSELDREWSKFRNGALIGIITSGALLVFFVLRFLIVAIRRLDTVDITFSIFVALFLIYSLYAMLVQYRFFNRWERRMGLLLHLEEELLGGKVEEQVS
jgi:membrane protein implicated in regulation of membrane protease activity